MTRSAALPPALAAAGDDAGTGFPWRVALALAGWLLLSCAWRPLLLPDEGRYASVAWEMLRSGSAVPLINGLPFFHKPPLLYALDLAALQTFGVNHFAARLGPATLGWLLGLALFLHARRWHGSTVAQAALAVLATTPFFFVGAQYVNHDIGVAACITAAVLAIVRAVDAGARIDSRWLLAGWALCGLGVLAKGLIGIVLPAAIVGPWLLAQGRWRTLLALLHPLGLLAFAAVVLPWMGWMQRLHPGFFDYFIVEQHFRRYTGTTFNNRMPGWFFLAVLPALTLPWSGWLLALRPATLGAAVPLATRARLGLYGWWLVVVLGFFSLPASKLVGYVLPALAPLALLLGLLLVQRGAPWRRVAVAAGAVCLMLVAALAWRAPGTHRELSAALAAQFKAGDRVAFIDEFFYDLPFDARLPQPVLVISAWDATDVAQRDNWRKELADASRFAPDRGAGVLWNWQRLPELRCAAAAGARVWLLTPAAHQARVAAALPGLQTLLSLRGVALQRLAAGPCPG